jgi:glucosamine--fructose-6-phosphate aminotransferase (isomerizing)
VVRESEATILTHAGPEIGVASTKAFVAQVVAAYLLAVRLGRARGTLSVEQGRELLDELRRLRPRMEALLSPETVRHVGDVARRHLDAKGFFFLGRGVNFPVALEGALKLKEIAYVHAEGYPAGEMKHGPIALIDEHLPVVVMTPRGPTYDKVVSNLAEVRARQGKVIAIATRGDVDIGSTADEVILIPDTAVELQPVLTVLPLQLLAYYVADFKGTDIDQPRNLAKSVTVE